MSLRAPRRSRLQAHCAPARHRTGGGHHDIAAARTGGSDVSLRAPRRPRLHAHWTPTRHHGPTATRKGGGEVSLRAPLSRLHTLCAPTRHRTGGGHHDIAVAHTGGE